MAQATGTAIRNRISAVVMSIEPVAKADHSVEALSTRASISTDGLNIRPSPLCAGAVPGTAAQQPEQQSGPGEGGGRPAVQQGEWQVQIPDRCRAAAQLGGIHRERVHRRN